MLHLLTASETVSALELDNADLQTRIEDLVNNSVKPYTQDQIEAYKSYRSQQIQNEKDISNLQYIVNL
jgi:hypothetical protein